MSKLYEILDGWGNRIKDNFGMLDPNIKQIASERLHLCNDCPLRVANTCSYTKSAEHIVTKKITKGCGCDIIAKAMSPTSSCILGKWLK